MADLSARKYDAHYRRLGLMPGATPDQVLQAAQALKAKLRPERFNSGPLKDIAPIRIGEIDESAMHLSIYWQRHGAAPPSIQNRAAITPQLLLSTESAYVPQPSHAIEVEFAEPQATTFLVAHEEDSHAQPFVTGNETEIRKSDQESLKNRTVLKNPTEQGDLVGPLEPAFNFSYFLFKQADGAVSPNADVIKSRSIIGLIIMAILWVAIPVLLVKILAFVFEGCGIDRWLDYFSILANVIPICFVPPLVIYEYAFFRQLQFPFAGALRLPVEQAIRECTSRLCAKSTGNSGGWKIESKTLDPMENGMLSVEILASYRGAEGESQLPLKIHMRVEELSAESSFLVYWFELDWKRLFKGRAVSLMKWARFELERLIKES